jgi:ATP-dependent Clp protease ATP-binding subunit ClpA
MNAGDSRFDWTQKLRASEITCCKILPDQPELATLVLNSIRAEATVRGDIKRTQGRLLLGRTSDDTAKKLATGLARFFFDDEQAVTCLHMQEYSERHQVSRLVGHSGGMVCEYFAGDLTDPVWHRPQCVVLLSEVEKAHPDVWQILVPILSEGSIIDGMGRRVRFRDSILIMTTRIVRTDCLEKILSSEHLRDVLSLITVSILGGANHQQELIA